MAAAGRVFAFAFAAAVCCVLIEEIKYALYLNLAQRHAKERYGRTLRHGTRKKYKIINSPGVPGPRKFAVRRTSRRSSRREKQGPRARAI